MITLLVLAISIALASRTTTLGLAVVVLSVLSIGVFFYNLIWQYRRIDRLMGGMPEASILYTFAFALLLPGYACVAISFLVKANGVGLLGAFLIVLGILFAQGSNALLLDHFIYGRRWRLAEPPSSVG